MAGQQDSVSGSYHWRSHNECAGIEEEKGWHPNNSELSAVHFSVQQIHWRCGSQWSTERLLPCPAKVQEALQIRILVSVWCGCNKQLHSRHYIDLNIKDVKTFHTELIQGLWLVSTQVASFLVVIPHGNQRSDFAHFPMRGSEKVCRCHYCHTSIKGTRLYDTANIVTNFFATVAEMMAAFSCITHTMKHLLLTNSYTHSAVLFMYTPVSTIIFVASTCSFPYCHSWSDKTWNTKVMRVNTWSNFISVMTNFQPLLDWLKPIYIYLYPGKP